MGIPQYDDDEGHDLSRMDKVQLAVHTQGVMEDLEQAKQRVAQKRAAKEAQAQEQAKQVVENQPLTKVQPSTEEVNASDF